MFWNEANGISDHSLRFFLCWAIYFNKNHTKFVVVRRSCQTKNVDAKMKIVCWSVIRFSTYDIAQIKYSAQMLILPKIHHNIFIEFIKISNEQIRFYVFARIFCVFYLCHSFVSMTQNHVFGFRLYMKLDP